MKKSFRNCDWIKKFPYAFFMRSILSENLSKYEVKLFLLLSFLPIMKLVTIEWVIYNVKGYLKPKWRLVTVDLRSKSCMCYVLETSSTRNFAADLSSSIITRFLGKV